MFFEVDSRGRFRVACEVPFEKLVNAMRNFLEGAFQPDTFLPLPYNIKVPTACLP
jgi:hypothetical protein